MKVYFRCPECDYPGKLEAPPASEWQCPSCDRTVRLVRDGSDPSLPACLVCGSSELYRKKDFPHGLGLTVLTTAFLASTITYLLYYKVLTWVILLGSAAFDGLLYLWVKDVLVCYRCGAHHRGVPPGTEHRPFELTIHERYRQERIRQEMASREGSR